MSASQRISRIRAAALSALPPLSAEALSRTAVLIPSADAHMSEYVAECDKRRAYLSGFTGSAGTAVLFPEVAIRETKSAALWTDGRYYAQASKELDKNCWELMRDGLAETPSIPQWLKNVGATHVAVDGKTLSLSLGRQLQHAGLQVVLSQGDNFVDVVWEKEGLRPARSEDPILVHSERFAGCSVVEKIRLVREKLNQQSVDVLVVSALDEVACMYFLSF